ncbi:MAG: NAD(P)/FAD-dependent oxidoreductase [Vicinamibacterales bacterium]
MPDCHEAIVVGGGPAGLATSRELVRGAIDHIVLERGDRIGYTWHNLYDSLVLHTGKHLSTLPGMPFPPRTPLFPTRRNFIDYLERYAETFQLPIETSVDVTKAERAADRWVLRTRDGRALESRALIIATGIVSNPWTPDVPGRDRFGGRVMHSAEYRRPEQISGRRVLIVGAGNSAGEISIELARDGATVTVAVQSGANVVPRQLLGVPIQYLSVLVNPLPRAVVERVTTAIGALRGPRVLPPPSPTGCLKVPLIGLGLANALRAGTIRLRGGLHSFTATGVRFADGSEESFDDVILATGYRAALGLLTGLIRTDRCGFGGRRNRVVSLDQPDLYFVGHNYDTRGALYNIARDARKAATRMSASARAQKVHPNAV